VCALQSDVGAIERRHPRTGIGRVEPGTNRKGGSACAGTHRRKRRDMERRLSLRGSLATHKYHRSVT
jgi:hypothetical protein